MPEAIKTTKVQLHESLEVKAKRVNEIRCSNPNCRGLLLIATTVVGEVKCHRCNYMNVLHIVAQSDMAKFFV